MSRITMKVYPTGYKVYVPGFDSQPMFCDKDNKVYIGDEQAMYPVLNGDTHIIAECASTGYNTSIRLGDPVKPIVISKALHSELNNNGDFDIVEKFVEERESVDKRFNRLEKTVGDLPTSFHVSKSIEKYCEPLEERIEALEKFIANAYAEDAE